MASDQLHGAWVVTAVHYDGANLWPEQQHGYANRGLLIVPGYDDGFWPEPSGTRRRALICWRCAPRLIAQWRSEAICERRRLAGAGRARLDGERSAQDEAAGFRRRLSGGVGRPNRWALGAYRPG